MSLMARVDGARSRLQAANDQLSGARGILNLDRGGESGEVGDGFSSFFERLRDEASDTWDSITNPIETAKDAWAGLQEAVDDPEQALKEAWNGLKAPFEDFKEDWNEGHEGEAIGRGLAEVVLLASPTKIFKGLKGLGALGGDSDDAPNDPSGSDGGEPEDAPSSDDESSNDDSDPDKNDGPAEDAVVTDIDKDAAVEGIDKTPDSQLNHIYDRHAEDFGVEGNRNDETKEQLKQTIKDHISDPKTEVINGTYKGEPAKHFYNPETGLNVFLKPDGGLWSGWQLSPAQANHLTTHGGLR